MCPSSPSSSASAENNNNNHNNSLYDRILSLRECFVAVDFDVSLWDSLFSAAAAATNANSNSSSTISSLASVLSFLQMDKDTMNIPTDYLKENDTAAYLTLEDFQHHHGHLHDALLHSICMALANATSCLYLQYARETAQSVQELERMYDTGIGILTNINAMQLQVGPPLEPSLAAVDEDEEEPMCSFPTTTITASRHHPSTIVTPTTSPLATGSDTELIVMSSTTTTNNSSSMEHHHHHHKSHHPTRSRRSVSASLM